MTLFDVYSKILETNKLISKGELYSLLEFITKEEYNWVASNFETTLNQDQIDNYNKVLIDLKNEIPIAYITHETNFYGNKFYVDENVLIPRQETELIIDLVQDFIIENSLKDFIIGDVCTGSGVLGITISKLWKKNEVFISDISSKALSVANKNISINNIENITILEGDFLNPFLKQNIKLDILICNPPYIDKNDKSLDLNVKKYEPNIALFAPNKGLYYYEELFKNINNIINFENNWGIFLEFGWEQKNDLELLLSKYNIKNNYNFIKDLFGNWRYLVIWRGYNVK